MRIDPAGWPFVLGALVLALLVALAAHPAWSVPFLVLSGVFLFFFRDPERPTEAAVADVVSPADGRVVLAGDPEPGAAPPGQWKQVSIFLSPMDVHVNRVPVSGRVLRVEYKPGKFLPAYKREAAIDNERNEVWIDHAGQTIVCRQVVGILARRIVCRVPVGADVRTVYHGHLSITGSLLGWVLHRDPDTYRYIPESIRQYPGAPAVVALLREAGFENARWNRVLGGLMAIHVARVPYSDTRG